MCRNKKWGIEKFLAFNLLRYPSNHRRNDFVGGRQTTRNVHSRFEPFSNKYDSILNKSL